MIKFPKKIVIYAMGVFTGVGIAVASLSGAADSVIPYQFKDGQVISADTLNDLFSQIKNATQGYSSEADLNGVWTCHTYDSSDGAGITVNTPSANFSRDASTGLFALTQTWTFTSNGAALSTSPGARLGGILNNITGMCNNGTGDGGFTAKMIESSLMLTGTTAGCTNGNGYVLPINRVSPYKFRFTQGATVVSCVANNQPPSIPTDLTASVGSGGVSLSWTDAGGSPTGFSILKKSSGVYSQIGTVGSGITTYSDSSGVIGDMYRVKSSNTNGSSLPSSAALAK